MSECTESMFEHLSELTTENATLTAEVARLTGELERAKEMGRVMVAADTRHFGQARACYERAISAEADLERSRQECEGLRAWCKVAIRAYNNECYHAAAGYVQAGLNGEKFPETFADMSEGEKT